MRSVFYLDKKQHIILPKLLRRFTETNYSNFTLKFDQPMSPGMVLQVSYFKTIYEFDIEINPPN